MARVTMAQLAQEAGVDVSTVSRALRGDARRVAPATMRRIRDLADRRGYQPDALASALRTGRSLILGVLVPRMSDVAVSEMLEGIAQEAGELGYLTAITPTGCDRAVRDRAGAGLVAQRVDGMLVADSTVRAPLPRGLAGSGVPYLLTLRPAGRHPAVVADDLLGGRLAGEHLAGLGHRQVAVVAGPRDAPTSRARLAGFTAALADRGVAVAESCVVHGPWGVAEGYRAMSQILASGARPTGVFALNDHDAVGAAHALRDAGLTVGTDVALVGYNDVSISSHLEVPLTSVHTDLAAMGRTAVRSLVSMVRGGPAVSVSLPPHLVVRESSCPAR